MSARHRLVPLVLLLAGACAAVQPAPPAAPPAARPTPPVTPEAALATAQAGAAREGEEIARLAATLRGQPRDQVWAARKEAAVRTSYAAARGVPRGGLRSVECRASGCELLLEPGAETRPGGPGGRAAMLAWLAASEPCPFTLAPAAEAGSALRVLLDCRGAP